MKRILALLLCLTCLLGVLASCDDEPVTPIPTPNGDAASTPQGEEEDLTIKSLHLAQYTIVYPKDASDAVKNVAKSLATQINLFLTNGNTIAVIPDDQTAKTGYEILIGKTNRDASAAYYAEGAKAEYVIRNVDQNLVLAGFSDALIEKAAQYFASTYLSNVTDSRIAVVADYTYAPTKTLELSPTTASRTKIVYNASEPYLEELSEEMVAKVKAVIGTSLQRAEAGATYDGSKMEIMLGSYDFEEIKDVKDALWLDGYAIAVRGNKIVITASEAEDYAEAIETFAALLSSHLLTGTRKVLFEDNEIKRTLSADVLNNVPGASMAPTGVYPAGEGAYTAIFMEAGEELFTEYVANLKAAGFAQYSATNFDGEQRSTKNSFATYLSDVNSVDIEYHTAFSRMYITVTPRGTGLTLPRTSAPEYTPVDATQYPTIVTQLGTYEYHPTEHAMCYVIRLADGTFIVYDSAYGSLNGEPVAKEIYEVLKKQAPDPENIVISAWIISHPHTDHTGGFEQFAGRYATGRGITLKQMVYNFADDSVASTTERANQNAVRAGAKRFGAKVETVRPHTGNVLYYANVKFNVLYTQENILALNEGMESRYDGNASSMVLQMVTSDGCKVVFGGDHSAADMWYQNVTPFCESALAKWYGTFLESDVVTMFHHGLGGGADELIYPAIKPKIVMWPGTWFRINGQSNGQPYPTGNGGTYKLYEVTYNTYFSDLTPDVYHETPNANGVHGWFVSDDGIQILTFRDGAVTIQTYETRADYYNS